jgi:hypothetical protein
MFRRSRTCWPVPNDLHKHLFYRREFAYPSIASVTVEKALRPDERPLAAPDSCRGKQRPVTAPVKHKRPGVQPMNAYKVISNHASARGRHRNGIRRRGVSRCG